MTNIPSTYELIKEYSLSDVDSKGYLLLHKKSGAKIALVENDDNNKVFYIGFRTTPDNSTGVAHIMEHSVLCGSTKYPVKDPFIELAKGSLNTFLNAMTFPDKTVYPVASTNDKDFANLTDVYMDAVLHPNIYSNDKIFRQEGWHYELSEPNGELTYNGVVYNEMKGAFSNPDDVLEREILNTLFPDNTYAYESGGDPSDIPSLTYEDFLDFHRRYYHPSNSYIYIYGDCDMEERLTYLDSEYLSHYDRIDPKTEISPQPVFTEPKDTVREYPIAAGDDADSNTYYSLNFSVENILDGELYQAFNILDYALLNSPGAPVREALMKNEIGKDIIGGYNAGTLQPYFSIGVKGAKPSDKERFSKEVDRVLREIVKNGIDPKSLEAAINLQEFSFREADFGPYPKGLVYGLICMDSWLYDDNNPFLHLFAIPVFKTLREKISTGYYEDLIEKYLIQNKHRAFVTLVPKEGLAGERDKNTAGKLSDYRDSLSEGERQDIIDQCKALKEYQNEPSPESDIEKIPMLKRSDLKKEAHPIKNRLETVGEVPVLFHDLNSNGIHYLNLLFSLDDMDKKDIFDLSLMNRMMGLVDTENYTYAELSNETNIKTGGMYSSLSTYTTPDRELRFFYVVGAKFLEEYTEDAVNLCLEMMTGSQFTDNVRLRELLNQEISHLKMHMVSSGHQVAANRARARISKEANLLEYTSGIDFYEYLKDFDLNFNDRVESFKENCKRLYKKVFRKKGLLISSTGKRELTSQIEKYIPKITAKLSDEPLGQASDFGLLQAGNEGFKTAATVQFVARGGNYKEAGLPYRGELRVLKTILSYDYFWTKVRVLGGAYGCMAGFKRDGDSYFSSYRDPNLRATNDIFNATVDYIRDFDCSERDMTKYVIGTVGTMDTPLTPSQEGERSLSCYIQGLSFQEIQGDRDAVLSATPQDIRALSGHISSMMDENILCVVGSEDAIEEDAGLFDTVTTLA